MAKAAIQASENHKSRYMRFRLGCSYEQIAAQDRVEVKTVEESVKLVEAYRNMCTLNELESSTVDVVVSSSTLEKEALKACLTATKLDDRGKIVPDLDTRLKAVSVMNDKIKAIQPRSNGGFTQVQVAVDNREQKSAPAAVARTSMFEDRLRELKRRREEQKQLPPANQPNDFGSAIEAQYVEEDQAVSRDAAS